MSDNQSLDSVLYVSRDKLNTYFRLSLINGLVFTLCYGAANYYGTQINEHYSFYFSWESKIPFYPTWIYIYLSIFIWFLTPLYLLETASLSKLSRCFLITTVVACICFFIFPSESSFDRSRHEYGGHLIFNLVYFLDQPHNLLPSLHVSYVVLFLLIFRQEKVRILPVLYFWGFAMTLSVLLAHQHHIMDIIAGSLLGAFVYGRFYKFV